MTTDPTRAAEIVERLRSSAKAFRDHPIYDQDGVGVYLTVQAQECDQAADLIEALVQRPADSARADSLIARLRSEGCRNGGQGSYAWRARELCTEAANYLASLRPDTQAAKVGKEIVEWDRIARAAIIILEAIEAHCRNDAGLKGIDHADEGRRIRRGVQLFLASDYAATRDPQPAAAETVNTEEIPEVAAIRYLNDLRGEYGSIITILCDDEEAWTRDKQMAIEVCSDWTEWNPRRFYGESILQCAAKAVHSREALAAIRQTAKGGE